MNSFASSVSVGGMHIANSMSRAFRYLLSRFPLKVRPTYT